MLTHEPNLRNMHKLLLLTNLLISLTWVAHAQELDVERYRTFDGTYNNLAHPDWGAAGTNLTKFTGNGFADGVAQPAGADRPNPRIISNALFAQNKIISDPLTLSDFCWVWGQFIDHDFGLTPDGEEPLPIAVPRGDNWFDPANEGQAMIPMMRNLFDPNTGTSEGNPRQHPNVISTYIDGSMVYGSDQERADWLRTFEGGKMKVSSGNLLPFNTTTLEYEGEVIHEEFIEMENPVGLSEKFFVAGDVRANENPLLLAMHTLFVREHNRLCEELVQEHPDWTDEQLYQHARKINGGIIQSIVYNEWLPAMGIRLPEYNGYNPEINVNLANVFTAAAFRLGHTLINTQIRRLDQDGNPLPGGHLTLREAFFNPYVVIEDGLDPYFKGMASQTQQRFDAKVVDDVRNFLFGPPGAGGLDLPSINIARGRERGLPDYNTVREAYGLPRVRFFTQISSDATVFTVLQTTYNDVNSIDPWVGFLAEDKVPGTLFGETLLAIMTKHFVDLRDGDRFFFENDPMLTEEEKEMIRNTTFNDVVMRNTGIKFMQDKVFAAMAPEEICDNMSTEIHGIINAVNGEPFPGVSVNLGVGEIWQGVVSGMDGDFSFSPMLGCEDKVLSIEYEDNDYRNGVTTLDIILIQKHILGSQPLASPFQIIAADTDGSGSISTLDLIRIRRLILNLDQSFSNVPVWRFVPADYAFTNPEQPFIDGDFAKPMVFVGGGDRSQRVIAVKAGDVNGSARLVDNSAGALASRSPGVDPLVIRIPDVDFKAGRTATLVLQAAPNQPVEGTQFALHLVPDQIENLEIFAAEQQLLDEEHYQWYPETGQLMVSWNANTPLTEETEMLTLRLTTRENLPVGSLISLDDRLMANEAYTAQGEIRPVWLQIRGEEQPTAAGLMVYQNQPNPAETQTLLPFYLPQSGQVRLSLYDVNGRQVFAQERAFAAGFQNWNLDLSAIRIPGVVVAQFEFGGQSVNKKIVVVR